MGSISSVSHIVICEGITGSGTSVTFDTGQTYQYIKAPGPKINFKFNSKIKHRAFHKSRQTPDVKYVQSYKVSTAVFAALDVNTITEWITEAYINKNKIYLLVDFWSGAAWIKKSWYNSDNTKIYYLKGLLKDLTISQKSGRIWEIAFTFEECDD